MRPSTRASHQPASLHLCTAKVSRSIHQPPRRRRWMTPMQNGGVVIVPCREDCRRVGFWRGRRSIDCCATWMWRASTLRCGNRADRACCSTSQPQPGARAVGIARSPRTRNRRAVCVPYSCHHPGSTCAQTRRLFRWQALCARGAAGSSRRCARRPRGPRARAGRELGRSLGSAPVDAPRHAQSMGGRGS